MHNGYVLVLRDDLTSKIDLFYARSADAETMATALISWRARYDLPSAATIVTDQGSHFANSLLREISQQLKFQHHFTVAYAPWSNGTAEVTNQSILRLMRAILSEAGPEYTLEDWPKFLPQVVMYLNQMPRKSLMLAGSWRSPNAVFLGLPDEPDDIGPFTWRRTGEGWVCSRLDSAEIHASFEAFRKYLDSSHSEIADLRAVIRDRHRIDRSAGLLQCSFSVGDWVLYSTAHALKNRRKLQLRWLRTQSVVAWV
jgi:hypothetical protein